MVARRPARKAGLRRFGIACLWAVPSVAVTAGTVLVATARTGDLIDGYFVVDAVLGVSTSIVAAILVSHVPRNRLGYVFAVSGWAYALSTLVGGYAAAVVAWNWPGATAAAWASGWLFVLGMGPSITLLLAWFPDGRALSPRWRAVGGIGVAALATLTVAFMLSPQLQLTADIEVANPVGVEQIEALVAPALLGLVATGVASAVSLILRLRRSDEADRRRIAPYVAAAALAVVATTAGLALPAWEPLLQTLTLPLLPISAAVCVLRYRLFDIEVVVRRSLVWLGMTTLVVGGYVAVVQATANVLHRQAGIGESLLATAVVAIGFQPAQAALRRLVNRWLFGNRDDPDAALGRLGERLAVEAEPTQALTDATADVAIALAVPWVAVELRNEGTARTAAESGARPGWVTDDDVVRIPLVHAGRTQGDLLVSRRSPNEALSASDRALLGRLAQPLAAAAAAAALTEDLRRSREQIVVAREEERRRLRRDLHDGVGPLLASAAVHADAATLRMAREPDTVPAMLTVVSDTIQEAVIGLRRAIEGLRPPTLDEFGLVDAIAERGQAVAGPDGPALRVDAAQLPVLPAAIEVAAYRIALEAVTNAVRHAAAGHIVVCLTGPGGGHDLTVEVTDDGKGLPAGHTSGVGMASMRARAAELGGTLSVDAAPGGGTRVRAELPVTEASSWMP